MAQETKKNSMNIELPEDVAEGVYSNLAIIAHSQSEFVLDFIRMVPNVPKAKVKSRIIVTPFHIKRLANALADNIKKYEDKHGPIQEGGSNNPFPSMNFTPTAQA